MLATFGLQRVESHLNRGCVGAADVAEFLAQARPGDLRTLALDGMPEALDSFQRWHTRSIDQSRQLTLGAHHGESAISTDSTKGFCVASNVDE